MSEKTFDEAVLDFGFESPTEFHCMVADVDLSTAERYEAFKKWQEEDGTKAGLDRLPTKRPPIKVGVGVSGPTYTNESRVERLVIVKNGERTTKMLLAPGESNVVPDGDPQAEFTSTTDTSSARGRFELIGGCGTGCTHEGE